MISYIERARTGLSSGWRWLTTGVLTVVGGTALMAIAVVGLLASGRMPSNYKEALLHPTDAAFFFLINGLMFACYILALAGSARLVQHKRPADLTGGWDWRLFGVGAAIWLSCLVVNAGVDFLLQPRGFTWNPHWGGVGFVLFALLGLGVQTFAEELVFRGFLTQALLLAFKRPAPAAVLSGVVFGLLHIPNGGPQFVNAVIFGTVASLIAIRLGGIAFTFGVHLANNLFASAVVVSADDVFRGAPALVTQSTSGLLWVDVAIGAASLAVTAFVVYRVITPRLAASTI